jgi:hypothetical protein
MTCLLLALLEKKTEHYITQQPEAVNETEFALISLIKIMSIDRDTGPLVTTVEETVLSPKPHCLASSSLLCFLQ